MMRICRLLCWAGFIAISSTAALAQSGCDTGTYSVVQSDDGTALSVLFDAFTVQADGGVGKATTQIRCELHIPLHLREGFSLGVYRVDYRGFAHLPAKQSSSELTVNYGLGSDQRGRRFQRKVNGQYDADFLFTENIGAGLMKRAGCGDAAVLNVSIMLALNTQPSSEAVAGLDSSDGAPKGGLIYHLDTKKCH